MSTTYYIIDKKKKQEYENFKKFWEENVYPELRNKIERYCNEINGVLVNEDLAYDINSGKVKELSYCPIFDDCYSVRLGHMNFDKFVFSGYENVEGVVLNSVKDIKKFFENDENKEKYQIEDDCGEIQDIEKFIKCL